MDDIRWTCPFCHTGYDNAYHADCIDLLWWTRHTMRDRIRSALRVLRLSAGTAEAEVELCAAMELQP